MDGPNSADDPFSTLESNPNLQEEPVYIQTFSNADALIEDKLGLQLSQLLVLLGLSAFVFLLVSLLWNFCAGGEQDSNDNTTPSDNPDSSPNHKAGQEEIVVAEVRPGLVLITGSPTPKETFRILQEYERMTAGLAASGLRSANDATSGGYGSTAVAPPIVSGGDHLSQPFCHFDDAGARPPPYAPRGMPVD